MLEYSNKLDQPRLLKKATCTDCRLIIAI